MYLWTAIGLLSIQGLVSANPDPVTDFQNTLEGPLSFECRKGFGLFRVTTELGGDAAGGVGKRNIEADRRWRWECRKIDIFHELYCDWYEGINSVEEPIFFQCPANAFMAGVRSLFMPDSQDRVWDVKCCRIKTICMKHCFLPASPSAFNEEFTVTTEVEDGVFVGLFSDFSDTDLDRSYRLAVCECEYCGYRYKDHYK